MTELYIDGTLVILPENFSTTVKQENTLFTKKTFHTSYLILFYVPVKKQRPIPPCLFEPLVSPKRFGQERCS